MGLWVWFLVVARGLIDTPSWILYSNLSGLAWSLHTHICVCLRACECAAMNNIMPDVWCNRCLSISDNQSVSPRKTSYVGEIDAFLYLTTNLYRPAQRRRRYPRVPCLEQRPDGQGRRGDGRRRRPGAPASGSLTCICTFFCRGLPGGSLLHVLHPARACWCILDSVHFEFRPCAHHLLFFFDFAFSFLNNFYD